MIVRRCCVVVMVMMLGACNSPKTANDGAAAGDLAVTLFMGGEGRRYTWFDLKPDRTLGFSGGIDARQRIPKYDFKLTVEQVDAVWQLIQNEGLFDAQSAKADAPKTRWTLTMRRGRKRARVKSFDDVTPGIRRLHDLLFSYQAAERYNLPGLGTSR